MTAGINPVAAHRLGGKTVVRYGVLIEPVMLSRVLSPMARILYTLLNTRTEFTGGSNPTMGSVTQADLANMLQRTVSQEQRIERELARLQLMRRVDRKGGFVLVTPDWITTGHVFSLWPTEISNPIVRDAVLDLLRSDEDLHAFSGPFFRADAEPWDRDEDALPQKCGVSTAKMRSYEVLKSVLMPLDSMPLRSEEGGPYNHTISPAGASSAPGQGDPMERKSPREVLGEVPEAIRTRREKNIANKELRAMAFDRRPIEDVEPKTDPGADMPRPLNFDRVGGWGGRDWFRFISLAAKDLPEDDMVPLWVDEQIAAEIDQKPDEETGRRNQLDRSHYHGYSGSMVKNAAARRFVMDFVRFMARELLGGDTPENRRGFAAFLARGLFPNWDRFCLEYMKSKKRLDFNPGLVRKRIDRVREFHDTLVQVEDRPVMGPGEIRVPGRK